MFDSKYMPGAAPAAFDQQITDFIDNANPGGGGSMVVAIENEAGEVYRSITVHGLGCYMNLMSFLPKLGLRDKLKDQLYTGKIDSHFVVVG